MCWKNATHDGATYLSKNPAGMNCEAWVPKTVLLPCKENRMMISRAKYVSRMSEFLEVMMICKRGDL
jgi:hypothetical protein